MTRVGWVERSETHQGRNAGDGFAFDPPEIEGAEGRSTHPTDYGFSVRRAQPSLFLESKNFSLTIT
jgi:hypothetical protein